MSVEFTKLAPILLTLTIFFADLAKCVTLYQLQNKSCFEGFVLFARPHPFTYVGVASIPYINVL